MDLGPPLLSRLGRAGPAIWCAIVVTGHTPLWLVKDGDEFYAGAMERRKPLIMTAAAAMIGARTTKASCLQIYETVDGRKQESKV